MMIKNVRVFVLFCLRGDVCTCMRICAMSVPIVLQDIEFIKEDDDDDVIVFGDEYTTFDQLIETADSTTEDNHRIYALNLDNQQQQRIQRQAQIKRWQRKCVCFILILFLILLIIVFIQLKIIKTTTTTTQTPSSSSSSSSSTGG